MSMVLTRIYFEWTRIRMTRNYLFMAVARNIRPVFMVVARNIWPVFMVVARNIWSVIMVVARNIWSVFVMTTIGF